MIQVCDLSFANSSITDTLGNYSLVSSGTVTISSHTYPANTDPILYVTDSSYSCIEFGQTATYSNGAIIQAGIPDYGSENWAVEFRARVPSVPPVTTRPYVLFFGCSAPYADNGTIRTGGYWAISIDASLNTPDELRFFYDYNNEDLTLKDNLDFTAWHLYRVTKTAEDILTLHIDGVLVATIDIEQQTGFKSRATLGSFALLGAVEELPTANHIQTNQLVRLADVKVYADPMGHAEKAISLDNLSRVFRNYNTWLGAQLSGQIGDGTLTIQKNGANVATFTANQGTAATANITVPTAVSELTNDSGYLTSSSNLDASKLTSGTVDIARLPQGALERLIKVANEAARYALTTADVQLGDTVQQLDTGIMYVVTDTDHLDSAAGYTEYTAGTAASVPWSGVTGKPTFAAVATSGAYSDLMGTPTIPTVNDATLTIQKNGTDIATFSANSSTNATANITVPTKTSDLTNDSGFITEDTTKIPLAGSNAISGSLIPATTDAYDLGGSSYQWNNAYIKSLTINGVACGDILTHNASEFVDVSSNQTVGGIKTFSDIPIVVNGKTYVSQINASRADGTQAGFSANNGLKIICNQNSDAWDNTAFAIHLTEYTPTTGQINFKLYDCIENSTSYKGFFFKKDSNSFQLSPAGSNSTDLGTSTNKWKSFNGLNPGALSLPSMTYINLDTTNFDVTATTIGTFTPTVDGWAVLSISQKNKHFGIWVLLSSGYRVTFHSVYHNSDYMIFALIPVRANVSTAIYCTADDIDSTRKVDWLRLFPCQGNV